MNNRQLVKHSLKQVFIRSITTNHLIVHRLVIHKFMIPKVPIDYTNSLLSWLNNDIYCRQHKIFGCFYDFHCTTPKNEDLFFSFVVEGKPKIVQFTKRICLFKRYTAFPFLFFIKPYDLSKWLMIQKPSKKHPIIFKLRDEIKHEMKQRL